MQRIISQGSQGKFNSFCAVFFKALKETFAGTGNNIELHFNVTEEEVRRLAMRCKYAIKLDHKGMANNASAIVSCLGFFLPVFATYGFITDRSFTNFELNGKPGEEAYSGEYIPIQK